MARKPVGKIGVAPCGHRGEHLTTNYVQCLEGCESDSDDAPEIECCPFCQDLAVDLEYAMPPEYLVWNPGGQLFNRRCWECGGLWIKP